MTNFFKYMKTDLLKFLGYFKKNFFFWDNQDHSIYKIITERAGVLFQDAGMQTIICDST